MKRKILTPDLAEATEKICQVIYDELGVGGVTDYANKNDLPYGFCEPCDSSMPMIQTENDCNCAVCGTHFSSWSVLQIIEKKRKNIDCNEAESSIIKGWLSDFDELLTEDEAKRLSNFDDYLQIKTTLSKLFPLEYDEYLQNKPLSLEKIGACLLSDSTYNEDITKMIVFYLESKADEKEYWTDWFNGSDMKKH